MIDVLSFSGRCRSSSLLLLRTLEECSHGQARDKRVTALDIARLDPTHLLEDPDCVPGERLLEELVEPPDDPSLPAVEEDETIRQRLPEIHRVPVIAGGLNDVMDSARRLFGRLRANEPALVAILEVLVSVLEVLVSLGERCVAHFSPPPEASGLIAPFTVVTITPPRGVINCAGRGGCVSWQIRSRSSAGIH